MEFPYGMNLAATQGGFKMDDYWVWCGSAIKGEDGKYHLFASRWKKTQAMHPGWLFGSEIVRAVATSPEGPYTFEEVVLASRGPQYWDGMAVTNPHITKYEDTYVLYYIGTTFPFPVPLDDDKVQHEDLRTDVARAAKRIGMATSKSVFGPWKRLDEPILKPRPRAFDNLYTSNPAPCILQDGSVIMVYKGRGVLAHPSLYNGHIHGQMLLGLATAENYMGPYCQYGNTSLWGAESELEDPFIWQDGGKFFMIAKDMRGNICKEKYGGILAHSDNGLKWEIEQNVLAYSRRVHWDNGTVRLMGNLDRPFILFEGGEPICMFFATSDGTESFMDAKNTWNMTIPLYRK